MCGFNSAQSAWYSALKVDEVIAYIVVLLLFQHFMPVCGELPRLPDDPPSGIVGKHGRLSVEVHRAVHLSHRDVKINLMKDRQAEREREREMEGGGGG